MDLMARIDIVDWTQLSPEAKRNKILILQAMRDQDRKSALNRPKRKTAARKKTSTQKPADSKAAAKKALAGLSAEQLKKLAESYGL